MPEVEAEAELEADEPTDWVETSFEAAEAAGAESAEAEEAAGDRPLRQAHGDGLAEIGGALQPGRQARQGAAGQRRQVETAGQFDRSG